MSQVILFLACISAITMIRAKSINTVELQPICMQGQKPLEKSDPSKADFKRKINGILQKLKTHETNLERVMLNSNWYSSVNAEWPANIPNEAYVPDADIKIHQNIQKYIHIARKIIKDADRNYSYANHRQARYDLREIELAQVSVLCEFESYMKLMSRPYQYLSAAEVTQLHYDLKLESGNLLSLSQELIKRSHHYLKAMKFHLDQRLNSHSG